MSSTQESCLWTTPSRARWFLLPCEVPLMTGCFRVNSVTGQPAEVDEQWIASFEISEAEALVRVRKDLGETLGEIEDAIDNKLADWRRQLDEVEQTPIRDQSKVTPAAGATFLDFLKQLPRLVSDSVSGDEARVDSARKATAELERKFSESGLPVDERLRNFPDRMAKIHDSGPTTRK